MKKYYDLAPDSIELYHHFGDMPTKKSLKVQVPDLENRTVIVEEVFGLVEEVFGSVEEVFGLVEEEFGFRHAV